MIKINKNSWHYKFLDAWHFNPNNITNICDYLFVLIAPLFFIVTTPFVWSFGNAIGKADTSSYDGVLILSCVLWTLIGLSFALFFVLMFAFHNRYFLRIFRIISDMWEKISNIKIQKPKMPKICTRIEFVEK
jgi:hypothetical protein